MNTITAPGLPLKFSQALQYLPTDVSSLVDLGGGVGHLFDAIKAAHSPIEYLLAEKSKSALAEAQSRQVPNRELDIDAGPLPFTSNSFDVAFLSDVLEHVRNPWALLAEASRVSRKYIYIYGPNFASLGCRLEALMGHSIHQMSADRFGGLVDNRGRHLTHVTYMTYDSIIHWSTMLGLSVHKERVFWYRRYTPVRPILEKFFKNFGSVYEIVLIKNQEPDPSVNANFKFFDTE